MWSLSVPPLVKKTSSSFTPITFAASARAFSNESRAFCPSECTAEGFAPASRDSCNACVKISGSAGDVAAQSKYFEILDP